jgi:hypothetical protein
MELIQAYLEKVKRIGGIYVLKIRDIGIEEDVLHEIAEQWTHWMKKGVIGAPLIMVPDYAELDYEKVFTFERAMQILRSKGKVRRRIWNAHTHLFVDQDGIIMKYVNHDCVIPYQIKTKDMEAVDWELYRSEW